MRSEYSVRVTVSDETPLHASNRRRGTVNIGDGVDPTFTPVELLLAAVGGCAALDFSQVLAERGTQVGGLEVEVRGRRATDARLEHVDVRYVLPEGLEADDADVADAVRLTSELLCTVSRTLVHGCEVRHAAAPGTDAVEGPGEAGLGA